MLEKRDFMHLKIVYIVSIDQSTLDRQGEGRKSWSNLALPQQVGDQENKHAPTTTFCNCRFTDYTSS